MDKKSDRPEVSDWDREYLKRLGQYIEEANADSLRRHLERSGLERLVASLTMIAEYTTPARLEARHG